MLMNNTITGLKCILWIFNSRPCYLDLCFPQCKQYHFIIQLLYSIYIHQFEWWGQKKRYLHGKFIFIWMHAYESKLEITLVTANNNNNGIEKKICNTLTTEWNKLIIIVKMHIFLLGAKRFQRDGEKKYLLAVDKKRQSIPIERWLNGNKPQ